MTTVKENNSQNEVSLTIRRGLLDNRPRQLVINPNFLKFENKDLLSNLYTQIDKSEIADFRYGIKWIRGYQFTIGREYRIYVRSKSGEVVKINFKSLYGIKRKEYHKIYSDIIHALWAFYFVDITNNLLEKYSNGEDFSISDVHISKEHIVIKPVGIFMEQPKAVAWDKVGIRNYQTYLAIFSTEDSLNINRGYNYLTEWNTAVLWGVVKTIIDKLK